MNTAQETHFQGKVVYINQFKHAKDKSAALVVVYEAAFVDELAKLIVDPVEVAQMEWVDKTTWDSFEYYPEYKTALSKYFAS